MIWIFLDWLTHPIYGQLFVLACCLAIVVPVCAVGLVIQLLLTAKHACYGEYDSILTPWRKIFGLPTYHVHNYVKPQRLPKIPAGQRAQRDPAPTPARPKTDQESTYAGFTDAEIAGTDADDGR